ncbi:MAG TPA: MotA/TolQ/ExbB proton channel family protein [Phycisphaerales bacterium]|nr:MotA/TolQ/ExbB proton channel family protein [Phycisphaerales bacterium]
MSVMLLANAGGLNPGVNPAGIVETVWDMVVKGGWMMIPLGVCSLVALAIIVERMILTSRERVAPRGFLSAMQGMRRSPRQALAAARGERSAAGAVLAAVIAARGEERVQREKRAQDAGERQVIRLRERMRLLSSLPQVATMLGLLGTVFGMIRTFTVVAASGESLGKTEKLAQGIYEAWTATAAGLAVAIPTLVMYHVIMARIDAAARVLDETAQAWIETPEGVVAGEGAEGIGAGAAAQGLAGVES